jgi:hypothetical protein
MNSTSRDPLLTARIALRETALCKGSIRDTTLNLQCSLGAKLPEHQVRVRPLDESVFPALKIIPQSLSNFAATRFLLLRYPQKSPAPIATSPMMSPHRSYFDSYRLSGCK